MAAISDLHLATKVPGLGKTEACFNAWMSSKTYALCESSQHAWDCCLQLGFFSIVGIPLFKALVDLFPEAKPVLDGVTANFHHWEAATELADLPT